MDSSPETVEQPPPVVQLESRRPAQLTYADRLRRLELAVAQIALDLVRDIEHRTEDCERIEQLERAVGRLTVRQRRA